MSDVFLFVTLTAVDVQCLDTSIHWELQNDNILILSFLCKNLLVSMCQQPINKKQNSKSNAIYNNIKRTIKHPGIKATKYVKGFHTEKLQSGIQRSYRKYK